jgi:hypothetical protein
MKKRIYLSLFILTPLFNYAQLDILNEIDLRPKSFDFQVSGKASSNLLIAPSRQNTLPASGTEVFEEYHSLNGGVSAELILSPVIHENFFYTYRHEWSLGMGVGTSYHYQLWGNEFGIGKGGYYLTYHYKSRFMNIVGYTASASGDGVDETAHYSKYSGIRHQAFGVKLDIGDGSSIELAFLMEKFTTDQDREPWQGALVRWDNDDDGWGIETMLFWNHAAYGYYFTSVEPMEEYSPTGFFLNLKVSYRFGYRSNYGRVLDFL